MALITNSSFIDGKSFDGFRKIVYEEFSDIYIIDSGGNIHGGDKSGSIFGIKIGTAISFMIKKPEKTKVPCRIFYTKVAEDSAEAKLDFLAKTPFDKISFLHINPDDKSNWINLSDNDFDCLIPLISKDVKAGQGEQAIFKLFSSGIKTQRDEWVYDFSKSELENRMKFFVDVYERKRTTGEDSELNIKWDEDMSGYINRDIVKQFDHKHIACSLYRPFIRKYFYFDKHFNGRTYQMLNIFPNCELDNQVIGFMGQPEAKPFTVISANSVVDLNAVSPASGGTQCLPLYRYDKDGNRIDNITDWGLAQFKTHYNDSTITKLDIFNYTYAVLHNPAYRTKYELNLKREFPRIPFYDDFHKWVNSGKQLMDLHINYETVQPYPLKRIDLPLAKNRTPKAKLKADAVNGTIILDDVTTLEGIPKIAWEYRLGNRCALEWILDQYKEKKPKDPTIAEKFNTYRFADYKEQVIDLLQRVCTVSVETMQIIQQIQV
ncbi:MAG: type ISP restriction/modification enzyme [Nostoc sp.]